MMKAVVSLVEDGEFWRDCSDHIDVGDGAVLLEVGLEHSVMEFGINVVAEGLDELGRGERGEAVTRVRILRSPRCRPAV
jgi:hypothetical protein